MKKINNDITISIVTYFSDHLIYKRLDKLKKFKSVVIENSLKKKLKSALEKKYRSTKVILPNKNLGYGGGNNLAISKIKTKYCLIINPDAYLEKKDLNNSVLNDSHLKSDNQNSDVNELDKMNESNALKDDPTENFEVENRFDSSMEKLPGKPYQIINSLEQIEKILKN